MRPRAFMLIAGDPSGDLLAAELVSALREKILAVDGAGRDEPQPLRTPLAPQFFGAGGPRLAAAGVELACDMTRHSLIGVARALRKALVFFRHFRQLYALALARQPDAIIGVDYGAFNGLVARAVKRHVRRRAGEFRNWQPKIIQYVSPQVWASRPGRANRMAASHDLILSIIPFEKDWYARRVPGLAVRFVGHPMLDRYRDLAVGRLDAAGQGLPAPPSVRSGAPQVVLLPGSRAAELRHHLDLLLRTLQWLRGRLPQLRAKLVVPTPDLVELVKRFNPPADLEVQAGGLTAALAEADLALSKTGTITMECAFFQVPTVTFYRLPWIEYQIGKRIVNVKWISMPNLLADEEVLPEFIQDRATPENVGAAALDLLQSETRRRAVQGKLAKVIASLGGPGANARAAEAIVDLLR